MAGTKVTLRTAFNDKFVIGDLVITQAGTELPSRSRADEVIEAARRSGVTLYEVAPKGETKAAETKIEGSN